MEKKNILYLRKGKKMSSTDTAEQLRDLLRGDFDDISATALFGCDKGDEEKSVMAILSIKVACVYGRITTDEATELREQLNNHIPFDSNIMKKLSIGERSCLSDYNSTRDNDKTHVDDEGVEVKSSSRISINDGFYLVEKEVQELKCYVCNDYSSVKSGVFCSDMDSNCHFQCSECLTNWIEVLNQQRKENSTALQERHGLVKCCVDGCTSCPYSRATICHNITRSDVLEGFLDNLQYCESLSLYAEYQEKLQVATKELKDAIISDEVDSTYDQYDPTISKSTITSNNPAIEKLNVVVKRQELESLTGTFLKQFPDARMCPKCNFGPMINRACDNLLSHHNQVIKEIHNDEGTVKVQIDNRCPQCTFLSGTWSDYPCWDGSLPKVIRGDTFCLGSSSENGDSTEIIPVKVLTPAEAREQRVLALEKAAEETKKLKEAAMLLKCPNRQDPTTSTHLPTQSMKSILDIEADERNAKETAAKKLRMEKLKAKADRELILKQIKADRSL